MVDNCYKSKESKEEVFPINMASESVYRLQIRIGKVTY